jgi:hypothetical protein
VSIITLDFETYYDKDFSLRKMTTEEYIRDKRFQTIGVGIKIDDAPAYWVTGEIDELKKHLSTLSWNDSILLCHNTLFDGAILAWRFGIVPYIYADTMCMGRALDGVDSSVSLANMSKRYGVGLKGDEVDRAEGKYITGFTSSELEKYGKY